MTLGITVIITTITILSLPRRRELGRRAVRNGRRLFQRARQRDHRSLQPHAPRPEAVGAGEDNLLA